MDRVRRPRWSDVVSAGSPLHPDAVLSPAQQVAIIQLGPKIETEIKNISFIIVTRSK